MDFETLGSRWRPRGRRIVSWCVFAAGMTTLIATSAPPRWHLEKGATVVLQSAGPDDDKLLRVLVTLSGELARVDPHTELALEAHADRPASDISIVWGLPPEDEASVDAGQAPAPDDQAFYSQGFTQISSALWTQTTCPGTRSCPRTYEALFSAAAPSPYALDIAVIVNIRGDGEKPPKGSFSVSLEVVDAP